MVCLVFGTTTASPKWENCSEILCRNINMGAKSSGTSFRLKRIFFLKLNCVLLN